MKEKKQTVALLPQYKAYEYKIIKTNIVEEELEKLTSSINAINILKNFIGDQIDVSERFICLYLNRSNQVIAIVTISIGSISSTIVDLRILLKYAIDMLANGIIVCHNHPSGNTYPSDTDKEITERIKNVVTILDISLLDHIIVTKNSYYSFADNGLI